MGYHHTEADRAVFVRNQNGILSIIAVYVDELSMASDNFEVLLKDKAELSKQLVFKYAETAISVA